MFELVRYTLEGSGPEPVVLMTTEDLVEVVRLAQTHGLRVVKNIYEVVDSQVVHDYSTMTKESA